MMSFIRALLARRINQLLIFFFLFVSLIPVSMLGFKIYHAAWDNAWREINEKHRLLAMNLATPIQIYMEDKRRMMGILSRSVAQGLNQGASYQQLHENLRGVSRFLDDFQSLSLVDPHGASRCIRLQSNPAINPVARFPRIYQNNNTIRKAIDTKSWEISSVERSSISGNPTILMAFPITIGGKVVSVLVGELKLDEIEKLRNNIHFGKRGHSAIVDNKGRVVAHPNPAWVKEIKDLSHWKIVQRMLAGEQGVTEFYSTFVKQNMVAGYTGVPGLGWGIMVPQPKSEVEAQVNQILFSQLAWAIVGLIIAIAIAVFLARRITSPINSLADAANKLLSDEFKGELPRISTYAPHEVRELNNALVNLVTGLQDSRTKIGKLNETLQDNINEATMKLRVANIKLKANAEVAESASLTKSNFIANMSHELRTPLNAIIGYTQLLIEERRDSNDQSLVSDLHKINRSGQHLLLLINDILDISKIEAGKIELNIQEININDFLGDLELNIAPLAKEKSNILQISNQLDVDTIHSDAMKLKQILLNLLSNANKFTENGHINVDVKCVDQDGSKYIEFAVYDTGIGIPADRMEKIFDAYSQAETNISHDHTGTGLGLAISRHFAQILGGGITVESREAEGSTFILRILENEKSESLIGDRVKTK